MSKFIVSANYRDRESPYKWLVRKVGDGPKKAVACRSAQATGVRFVDSDHMEQGFGCSVVAECETAVITDAEPKIVKLRFNGMHFVRPNGEKVRQVEVLQLSENGDIEAVV